MHYTLADVIAEMKFRALNGCIGDYDGTCSDPEMDLHPEEWCDRCLEGAVVQAHEESTNATNGN